MGAANFSGITDVTRMHFRRLQVIYMVTLKGSAAIFFVKVTDEEREFGAAEDGLTDDVTSKEPGQKAGPLKTSEKVAVCEASNAYDFGQMVNAVSTTRDKAACAELLTVTEPKKLPALLSNKLEGEIFLIFIQAMEYYLVGKDPGLVYQHLFYLSKAERFKVRT